LGSQGPQDREVEGPSDTRIVEGRKKAVQKAVLAKRAKAELEALRAETVNPIDSATDDASLSSAIAGGTEMLEPISRYACFQKRHLEAPLFAERDRFLTHLESLGASHRELSMKALLSPAYRSNPEVRFLSSDNSS
jgi:hypothetical protein